MAHEHPPVAEVIGLRGGGVEPGPGPRGARRLERPPAAATRSALHGWGARPPPPSAHIRKVVCRQRGRPNAWEESGVERRRKKPERRRSSANRLELACEW